MAAGRRITITVSEPGYRDPALQGEYVPGAVTALGVWPDAGTCPRNSR